MEAIKAKIEQNKADQSRLREEQGRLEAELEAEREKTSLRHGDYGYDIKGDPTLVVTKNRGGKLVRCSLEKGGGLQDMEFDYSNDLIATVTGNLVDDLKAMQSPLEEFKTKDKHGDNGEVLLGVLGNTIHFRFGTGMIFEIEQAQEIHQKLGRVLATAKRRKEK